MCVIGPPSGWVTGKIKASGAGLSHCSVGNTCTFTLVYADEEDGEGNEGQLSLRAWLIGRMHVFARTHTHTHKHKAHCV